LAVRVADCCKVRGASRDDQRRGGKSDNPSA
jgi:hypothetical protein